MWALLSADIKVCKIPLPGILILASRWVAMSFEAGLVERLEHGMLEMTSHGRQHVSAVISERMYFV